MLEYALNLEQSYYDKIHTGQIRVVGTWIKISGEPMQSCLVLLNANKKIGAHPPFVVMGNTVSAWIEETDADQNQIAIMAMNAVNALGGNPMDNRQCFAVIDAVRAAVEEVVESPMWQHEGAATVLGEARRLDHETGDVERREVKLLH